MSWSINFIGKPENVATALNEHSSKVRDQSKVEYDAALPAMIGLVTQNWGNDNPLIKISANGTGYSSNGEQIQRSCIVTIERLYGVLV